jgi:CheY-like chemotaxis protein
VNGGESLRRGLISFDIDGTLEFGDPPGLVTVEIVRRARELGFVIGSCSDRTLGTQARLWQEAGLEVDFMVLKQNLDTVRAQFALASYLHVGDTPLDLRMATAAGFDFVHSLGVDGEGGWLAEHVSRLGLGRLHVLLAEDIAGYRERISALIEGPALALTGVADGQEAIEYIEDLDRPLDLLITDLEMPRRNGWQVIEALMTYRPGVPVIMQTGEAHYSWVQERAAVLGIVLIAKAHVDVSLLASVRSALGLAD